MRGSSCFSSMPGTGTLRVVYVVVVIIVFLPFSFRGFFDGSDGKEYACYVGNPGSVSGFDPWFRKISWRKKEMATYSGILAGRIPWTEKLDGLQFLWSLKSWDMT